MALAKKTTANATTIEIRLPMIEIASVSSVPQAVSVRNSGLRSGGKSLVA